MKKSAGWIASYSQRRLPGQLPSLNCRRGPVGHDPRYPWVMVKGKQSSSKKKGTK